MPAQIDFGMKDLKEFDISFIGLKEGLHQFEYVIKKPFFDFFNFNDFNDSNVSVTLSFLKKTTLFELEFSFNGWVEVACDLTNELYNQPISGNLSLIVKFGDEFNNENEALLILPHGEFKLNVAQYIYEAIVLAVPLKRVHPGVLDGSLKSEVLEKLKEFEVKEIVDEQTTEQIDVDDIDPRWNKLKDILIDKNTSNGTS